MRIVLACLAMGAVAIACSGPASEPIGIDEENATWDARQYCRTTTCDVPAGWPQGTECEPPGWADECAKSGKWDVPQWWRTSCVGYSVEKDASRRVTYDEAAQAAANAFHAWSSADCGDGAPTIEGRDLGPTCVSAGWSQDGPNRNVIAFYDQTWPEDDGPRTIALTRVSMNTRTGEILDADVEVNEVNHNVRALRAPTPGSYDLQVVLTHEIGHFLGLAHSSSFDAVMYASDEGTSLAKRHLAPGDVAGICAIYPRGARSVSTYVDPTGRVAAGACDTTPAGGLATACP